MNTDKNISKKLVYMAVLIALSYIGSLIKITGTIAFDSFPAFFGALALGGVYGGIIGFLGHLFTAFLSGFPFTLPIHLVIAVMMFIWGKKLVSSTPSIKYKNLLVDRVNVKNTMIP